MTFSVAVAGASGYAGGEFLRLILAHPEAQIGAVAAYSSAGDRLGQHQPHLLDLADRILEPTKLETFLGHDVVVLGLPHGQSGELSAQLQTAAPDTIVLDLAADHRLVSAQDWADYYGNEYAGAWTYGLPELLKAGETTAHAKRAEIAAATKLAIPGCNATAVTLAIQPGISAGLVDETRINAALTVGYSGAGKAAKTHLLASEAAGNLVPYAVGGSHRHIPEIKQSLRFAGAADPSLTFTPVLAPVSRGILATVTAPLAPGADPAAVRAAWEQAYSQERFVHLLPDGVWPTTGAVTGSNSALVQVGVDERAGTVIALVALDNLVKGTAGQAIQALNLALGLPEDTGLNVNGVAP